MNILAVDPSPISSAEYLDDRRVRQNMRDASIMLSTALYARQSTAGQLRLSALTLNRMDHPAYFNSPMMRWVRQTRGNYYWMYHYFFALMGIVETNLKLDVSDYRAKGRIYSIHGEYMPEGLLMPFRNMAKNKYYGMDHTNMNDVHEAYKLYLQDIWQIEARGPRPPLWTGRQSHD